MSTRRVRTRRSRRARSSGASSRTRRASIRGAARGAISTSCRPRPIRRCGRARRSGCAPRPGSSVWESFQAEQRLLTPLPALLPEPFDLVAQRRAGRDATLAFEGRACSVPFRFADQVVKLRGCAATVQVWAQGGIVAEHARATRARIVLDPPHYEGKSTERVAAPVPLSRMARRLAEILALAPAQRPIDYYVGLAEAAR